MTASEISIVDYNWLLTPHGELLHHAHLTPKQLAEIEEEGSLLKPRQTLDCGRKASRFDIPGVLSRMGRDRCRRCCEMNGLPPGVGSPKNDRECRRILGMDS